METNESRQGVKLKPFSKEMYRLAWLNSLSVGVTLERFTTWSTAGVGATLVLLVGTFEGASKLITAEGIKRALVCFLVSLLAGALCKYLGGFVAMLARLARRMPKVAAESQDKLIAMDVFLTEDNACEMMARPYWWPMSFFVKRAFRKAHDSTLEERAIGFLNWQMLLVGLHSLFAGLGFFALCSSFR